MRTDWQSVFLSLLIPVVVAAGLIDLAWQPTQTGDAEDLRLAVMVLLPFEFLRIVVMWILRDAYNAYRGPARAIKFFLVSILVLAGIVLFIALLEMGFRDLFAALSDPAIQRLIFVPTLLIVVDGAISLYSFRGNGRIAAARLDAAAEEAWDWLALSLGRLLPMAGMLLVLFMVVRGSEAWEEDSRRAALLFLAVYFVGKGALFAHVYSARFAKTGLRVLAAREFVAMLYFGSDRVERRNAEEQEAKKVAERRTLFAQEGGQH